MRISLAPLPALVMGLTLAMLGSCTSGTSVSTAERSEYEGSAERRLAALGARIDSLKAEADSAGYELQARVEDLERHREVAREKFAKLKDAAGERWADVKRETAEALDELERRAERLRQRP